MRCPPTIKTLKFSQGKVDTIQCVIFEIPDTFSRLPHNKFYSIVKIRTPRQKWQQQNLQTSYMLDIAFEI